MKRPRKKTIRTRMAKAFPITRAGWADFYEARFNKTQDPQAAILAMWYRFLSYLEN